MQRCTLTSHGLTSLQRLHLQAEQYSQSIEVNKVRPYQEENARRAGTTRLDCEKKSEACDKPLAKKFQVCSGVCLKKNLIYFSQRSEPFFSLIFNLTCFYMLYHFSKLIILMTEPSLLLYHLSNSLFQWTNLCYYFIIFLNCYFDERIFAFALSFF